MYCVGKWVRVLGLAWHLRGPLFIMISNLVPDDRSIEKARYASLDCRLKSVSNPQTARGQLTMMLNGSVGPALPEKLKQIPLPDRVKKALCGTVSSPPTIDSERPGELCKAHTDVSRLARC